MYFLSNCCAFCLVYDTHITSLDRISVSVRELLSHIFEDMYQESQIPKQICDKCLDIFNGFIEFVQKCVENMSTFDAYVLKLQPCGTYKTFSVPVIDVCKYGKFKKGNNDGNENTRKQKNSKCNSTKLRIKSKNAKMHKNRHKLDKTLSVTLVDIFKERKCKKVFNNTENNITISDKLSNDELKKCEKACNVHENNITSSEKLPNYELNTSVKICDEYEDNIASTEELPNHKLNKSEKECNDYRNKITSSEKLPDYELNRNVKISDDYEDNIVSTGELPNHEFKKSKKVCNGYINNITSLEKLPNYELNRNVKICDDLEDNITSSEKPPDYELNRNVQICDFYEDNIASRGELPNHELKKTEKVCKRPNYVKTSEKMCTDYENNGAGTEKLRNKEFGSELSETENNNQQVCTGSDKIDDILKRYENTLETIHVKQEIHEELIIEEDEYGSFETEEQDSSSQINKIIYQEHSYNIPEDLTNGEPDILRSIDDEVILDFTVKNGVLELVPKLHLEQGDTYELSGDGDDHLQGHMNNGVTSNDDDEDEIDVVNVDENLLISRDDVPFQGDRFIQERTAESTLNWKRGLGAPKAKRKKKPKTKRLFSTKGSKRQRKKTTSGTSNSGLRNVRLPNKPKPSTDPWYPELSDFEVGSTNGRSLHNVMERIRREELADAFNCLRLTLSMPYVSEKGRATKVAILKEAITCCNSLTQEQLLYQEQTCDLLLRRKNLVNQLCLLKQSSVAS